MRRFTISTVATGRERTVDVRVYPTARHMRRAVTRDALNTGRPANFADAGAVTSCCFVEKLQDGEWVGTPQAGTIWLIEGHVTPEIAAHEATHMAAGIYDRDMMVTPEPLPSEPSGDGAWVEALFPDMPREEVFCYIVSDLTREILERI